MPIPLGLAGAGRRRRAIRLQSMESNGRAPIVIDDEDSRTDSLLPAAP
ncbi:MAG TPA: hypothetical protein VIE46_09970 [Gemmatimonadales bacterium]